MIFVMDWFFAGASVKRSILCTKGELQFGTACDKFGTSQRLAPVPTQNAQEFFVFLGVYMCNVILSQTLIQSLQGINTWAKKVFFESI